MVELVDLSLTNIDKCDVVCVRGGKNKTGIHSKKDWLKERFKEGLCFKQLIVDGRSWGFIEYLPAEYAWRPISAPGYLFIDCLRVIGRQKGNGYGKMLLDACLNDAEATNGVAVLSTPHNFAVKKSFFLKQCFKHWE